MLAQDMGNCKLCIIMMCAPAYTKTTPTIQLDWEDGGVQVKSGQWARLFFSNHSLLQSAEMKKLPSFSNYTTTPNIRPPWVLIFFCSIHEPFQLWNYFLCYLGQIDRVE